MTYRPSIHAYITDEAHDAWKTFADENGVSVTALIESLGHDLAKEIADAGDPMGVRQDWVRAARKVVAERRSRRGDR